MSYNNFVIKIYHFYTNQLSIIRKKNIKKFTLLQMFIFLKSVTKDNF